MIRRSGVQQIFATPVWATDLEPAYAETLNARLLAEIRRLMGPQGELTVGRSNWQTDPLLHKLPEFSEFVGLVEDAAQRAAEYLKLRSRDFVVTGCWANYNPPGAHNPSHSHPNNYFSGVYYVAVADGAARIAFEDPRPQAQVMLPPVVEHTAYNGNIVLMEARPGRLLLFPAWLGHSVPVNRSPEVRVSISYNLMFRGYAEEISPPLWEGTSKIDAQDS
ncbi:MAG: hypothetical protein FJX55_12560 [Alphaproteobacteria bacterium]|nr:hypothetical protein [Alphaproteobacteria bacterium]